MCRKHDYDVKHCRSITIPEQVIYNAFADMVNKLRIYSKPIISDTIEQMEQLYSKASGTAEKIREIDRSIAELINKNLVLVRLNSKGKLKTSERFSFALYKKLLEFESDTLLLIYLFQYL